MEAFTCACGQPLFYDNQQCLGCGAQVAYDPSTCTLAALVPAGPELWSLAGDARRPAPMFRLCAHRHAPAACNWLVPGSDAHVTCVACRTTRTIPSLDRPKNAERLREIEAAKRRLFHTLLVLKLPIDPKQDDPQTGMSFDLLESLPEGPPVLTGHASGHITINVAEADDDYREYHREALKEPYRTVLGHLRHEIGHYYWDRLIWDTPWLARFRELFGDERADYGEALRKQYRDGPPPNWRDRYISSYAACHPWEDWAETWAHFMHARATLETARSFGLGIGNTPLRMTPFTVGDLYRSDPVDACERFRDWANGWVVLTAVLNEVARSMGQPDLYPFVLSRSVLRKAHFINCVIESYATVHVALPPQPEELLAPGT